MFDVNVVVTEQDRDCGPACLKMLLDYYDIEEEIEILREKCHVGIRGCTARDLKRVGIEYGLDMIVYGEDGGIDAEELITQDRPAILWWKYNHFVIFAGLDDDGVPVICDPSLGRLPLPFSTFKVFFSGASIWNGDPQPIED